MRKPLTPIEILDRLSLAAAHLHDVGWTQGRMAAWDTSRVPATSRHADSYCLWGSLYAACFLLGDAGEVAMPSLAVQQQMANLLSVSLGLPPLGIPPWNDARSRRKEEVLELLSQVAHSLSSK